MIFFYLILLIIVSFYFFINQFYRRFYIKLLIIILICTLMRLWILCKIWVACPRIWHEFLPFQTSRCVRSVNHKRVLLSFRYLSSLRTNLLRIKNIDVLVIGLLFFNVAFNIIDYFILKLSCVTFVSLRIKFTICSLTCLKHCLLIILHILTIVTLKCSV